MDVLQDLSHMGTVEQAGIWDKTGGIRGSRSICVMHLTSQTKTSHILPPPSRLVASSLQADGFQSIFIQCGSVAKETTIWKGEPLWKPEEGNQCRSLRG